MYVTEAPVATTLITGAIASFIGFFVWLREFLCSLLPKEKSARNCKKVRRCGRKAIGVQGFRAGGVTIEVEGCFRCERDDNGFEARVAAQRVPLWMGLEHAVTEER